MTFSYFCMFVANFVGTARENRVAAHSHIKGLGLRDDGMAEQTAAGFIGQQQAREVLP
jgi:RuvB-like protein 1